MMEGIRNRKPNSNPGNNNIAFSRSHDGRSRTIIQYLFVYKWKLLLVIFLFLLIIFLQWPQPTLSSRANSWLDSGKIFKFHGYDIFYQDIVKNDQSNKLERNLLVIHGFPHSSFIWKRVAAELQKGFTRIIMPDMLGMGFSDKPKNYVYLLKEQATMHEELLHYLNVKEVHIIGHDYGDSVAQELLSRYDDPKYDFKFHIKSICFTNGGILPLNHHPTLIQKAMVTPVIRTILSYMMNFYLYKSRLSAIFGPHTQPSAEDLYDIWAIMLYKKGNLVLSDLLAYGAERELNVNRWVGALERTQVPLHLIYGPLDPVNTPSSFLKKFKELFPHITYTVLEEIGHFPHIEDEVGFINSYDSFLNRIG